MKNNTLALIGSVLLNVFLAAILIADVFVMKDLHTNLEYLFERAQLRDAEIVQLNGLLSEGIQEETYTFLLYQKIGGRWEFILNMELTRDDIPYTLPRGAEWCLVNSFALWRYGETNAIELLCEVTMP